MHTLRLLPRAARHQDNCLNIVMEYASEGDLAELVAKRAEEKRAFTEDEIMFWCARGRPAPPRRTCPRGTGPTAPHWAALARRTRPARRFVQIVLALYHVHSKNILHRDLKSQNIFISEGAPLALLVG